MTNKQPPLDIYPVALRKLFYDNFSGSLELSTEEILEARSWKRQLDLDIMEIENQLNTFGL